MSVNIGINIQRSPNRINQQLREAGVEGKYPKLLLDFKDQYYLASGGSKTLANAVTHARSTNAVMTDGYGPELVTNGGFDSDSDWTKGTGWSISGSKAYHASGANSNITQSIAVEADKAYIIEFNILEGGADFLWFAVAGVFTAVDSPQVRGKRSFVFTHDTTESIAVGIRAGSSNVATIDNVSVREMPVLKWAPHNFQEYSDDVSQGSGQVGVDRTATTLTETTSAGEHRIQCGITNPVVGQKFTMAVEAKSGTGSRNICFRGYGQGGATSYPVFDIVNGTVRQTGTGFTDVSITDVGDGYYLCKASVVTTSSFRWAVHMADETATLGNNAVHNYTGDGSSSVLLRKLRQYNSNLGGMTDNPDNSGNDADFVATSGSAKYLPRIGHHVYNGSAWVNEGVLAESESRVNLMPKSYIGDDVYDTSYTQNVTVDDNYTTSVSPAGNYDAAAILETANNTFHRINPVATYEVNQPYTHSVYVKSIGGRHLQFSFSSNRFGSIYINFDLANGVVGTVGGYDHYSIEDVGNNWYRCSATATCTIAGTGDASIVVVTSPTAGRLETFAGDTTKGLLIYGVQVEKGSTPSSLIPTSGQQGTREAESFTIPSANLPWPSPNYIGSELVTNGTFDTDSDWIKGTGWTISGGTASSDGSQTANSQLDSTNSMTLEAGKLYLVSYDVVRTSGTVSISVTTELDYQSTTSSGTYSYEVLATGGTRTVKIRANSSFIGSVDNISVREINPLSVSIGMEGRVTYADEDTTSQTQFFRWRDDGDNYIFARIRTDQGTGRIDFLQEESNVTDVVNTDGSYLSPDVNIPFNIASRHGSTFINGAVDGVALTANTTPTALSDLSATDLSLAYDYMGTIGTFRVWDKDLGDDGIVEATNPSLEPSLSLTFEGTGTNSFVVNNWAE